jgi:hypothetical protein
MAEKPSRRGFLGMLTKVALGVVAGAAALTTGTAKAYDVVCCHLAKAPSNGYCAYNCWRYAAQGYHERSWSCTYAGTVYTCFECTSGASCWNPDWLCSDYFPA